MYKIMWETLSLVNLLQSHTSQKQSTTRWARSTCTAELWLDNVLRIHTSKGRAVRPWTGSGNSRWCVVIGGQTPNVWARPCTPYCSMLMQTNGSQGTRGDLCAVSEVLMRAYGWSAPSMLVRRRRGNASCTKQTRIYFVRRSGRPEHYNDIQPTASDRQENIKVQARWANMSWAKLLAEQLCLFHDKELLGKLLLLKMTVTKDDRQVMIGNTAMLVSLNLHTAGLRVWSKSVMSQLPSRNWFAVYAFTFPHVGRTARLPNQDVILGDLVESVLEFWWALEVSEMLAMQKYSEDESGYRCMHSNSDDGDTAEKGSQSDKYGAYDGRVTAPTTDDATKSAANASSYDFTLTEWSRPFTPHAAGRTKRVEWARDETASHSRNRDYDSDKRDDGKPLRVGSPKIVKRRHITTHDIADAEEGSALRQQNHLLSYISQTCQTTT